MNLRYRILVLSFASLLFLINAGLYNMSFNEGIAVFRVSSFPVSQHFSLKDYFLFTYSDFGIKNKFNTDNIDKILKKITFDKNLYNFYFINYFKSYPDFSHFRDPVLVAELFGPPDKCFPFNCFW